MIILRKYGAAATIDGIPLITAGAADFKGSPTLASGDAKLSKDGGATANLATLPAVTPASGKMVRIALSATEMECARAAVHLIDQTSPKEWEDQCIIIETYGNASATHAVDLNDAVRAGLTALPNVASGSAGAIPTTGTGANQISVTSGAVVAGSLGTTAKSDINAEVVDALATDTYAEPSAVPAATSTLKDKLNWLFALARNKVTQTDSTETLRNDADSGNIGTASVSDDGTTFTRAEWS